MNAMPWPRCAYELRVGGHGPCRCGLLLGHRDPEHVCPHGYGQEILEPEVRA
jgi:hypothetical protein